MTIKEFGKYFKDHAKPVQNYPASKIRSLCITLDYWGVVLYRFDKPELRDIIIVNPQFFIQNLNNLLGDKLRQRNGVILKTEVAEVLNMGAEKADAFLKVLVSFKILFDLPVKNSGNDLSYISPMYLGERPGYVDMLLTNFVAFYRIRYNGYYHKGILLDCFSKMGKDIYFEQGFFFYWQWGMVLKRGDQVICIEFDKDNLNQIFIRLLRKGRERIGGDAFLVEVLGAFEKINENYDCALELSLEGRYFVPKRRLLDELEIGVAKFEWDGKLFDARQFSFLFRPEEPSMPYRRVFISYSSKDRGFLDQLATHLLPYKTTGLISFWDDLMLHPREQWDDQIKDEMNKANILIMLLSPSYLGTDYIIREEIPLAIRNLESPVGYKRVYWVLLKPCSYELFPEVAQYPIYPLKEKDPVSGLATQKAISEHADWDREWVKLLAIMFNDEG